MIKIEKSGNRVNVFGNIKTIEDAKRLQEILQNNTDKYIILIIHDSFVIPSSVIGTLFDLYDEEKKDIHIQVKEEILFDLFKELGLDRMFRVEKIS